MPLHRAPPDALQKRLSRLPNPPPDVITVYMGEKKDSKMSKLKRGLSVEDRAIAERLEKLKKDRKASMDIPSEAEMADRLAKLKGTTPGSTKMTANDERALKGIQTDRRSDIERSDDLIKAMSAEVAIDGQRQRPEDEVAERLARLRGEEYKPDSPASSRQTVDPSKYLASLQSNQGPTSSNATNVGPDSNIQDLCKVINEISVSADKEANVALDEYRNDPELQERVGQAIASGGGCKSKDDAETSSDVDEEEEEARLVERILAEAKLDENMLDDLSGDEGTKVSRAPRLKNSQNPGIPDRSSPSEEFLWCVICNEDADFRSSLTGDLYCQACVRECHDEEEVREHKFHRFSAKR